MVAPVRRVLGLLACLCDVTHAQALTDPTRPPATMMTRAENIATPVSATAITTARLQSILISPGRRVAIISGVTVALNGRFGDAVLIAINDSEVTLRSGRTDTILTLYPDLLKPTSGPVTAAPSSQQARHPS